MKTIACLTRRVLCKSDRGKGRPAIVIPKYTKELDIIVYQKSIVELSIYNMKAKVENITITQHYQINLYSYTCATLTKVSLDNTVLDRRQAWSS